MENNKFFLESKFTNITKCIINPLLYLIFSIILASFIFTICHYKIEYIPIIIIISILITIFLSWFWKKI